MSLISNFRFIPLFAPLETSESELVQLDINLILEHDVLEEEQASGLVIASYYFRFNREAKTTTITTPPAAANINVASTS